MGELMTASVVVLWILVLVLAALLFALSRQVGVILERISPVGALMTNSLLRVGGPAPALRLESLEGQEVALGDLGPASQGGRSTLVFFVGPQCPICRGLLPVAKSIARRESKWLDLVLASDGGTEESHRAYVAKHKLDGIAYVVSEALGRAYGVAKLPFAVLIDEQRRISSFGMVNSRDHLESLFEAKERRVESLQQYLSDRRDGT